MPVGKSPASAADVNNSIGMHLQQFVNIKAIINQDQAWLLATDLKVDPYNFTSAEETLIKSAVAGLDTTLDTVDMTFISRLIGLF